VDMTGIKEVGPECVRQLLKHLVNHTKRLQIRRG
jgi:hypothetical protein